MAYQMQTSVFQLEKRDVKAMNIITDAAMKNAAMSASIGFFGNLIQIPFISIGAQAVELGAQFAFIYKPLVDELAAVYASSPDNFSTAFIIGGMTADAATSLAVQQLRPLIEKILEQILQKAAFEILSKEAATIIPLIGAGIAATADAAIAAYITWAVGVAVAGHFEGGEKWLSQKKDLIAYVKSLIQKSGFFSSLTPKVKNAVDLNRLWRDEGDIRENHLYAVLEMIKIVRRVAPHVSYKQLHEALAASQIPEDLLMEALDKSTFWLSTGTLGVKANDIVVAREIVKIVRRVDPLVEDVKLRSVLSQSNIPSATIDQALSQE